jgi:hypothetical protein
LHAAGQFPGHGIGFRVLGVDRPNPWFTISLGTGAGGLMSISASAPCTYIDGTPLPSS